MIHQHAMTKACAVLAAALTLASAAATAAPSVAELAGTCRAALAEGSSAYSGAAAAACDWYLDPCGVCDASAAPAAWCPPADLGGAARARALLPALEQIAAQAPDRPAPDAVADVLRARFPCAAGE